MHPADMIFFWARSDPERLALLQANMAVTYRALAEATEAISGHLERYALMAGGPPVAVAVGDPAKLLAVCFALLRGGVATAPVNVNMPPQLIANDIHTLICDDPNLMLAGGRTIRFDDSWLRRKDQQ